MKTKARIIGVLFVFALVAGCAEAPTRPPAELPDTYITKAQELEAQGDLVKALEQYKVALTVDPENRMAKEKVGQLESKLGELAEKHYQDGVAFRRKGEYNRARQEFLTALRYNPDHSEARKILQERAIEPQQVKGYVLHTIQPDESLSMVAKKYYGDYKKFQIIAEYNQLEDATKVKVGQEIKVPVIEGIPFLGSQDEIVTVAGMAPERPVTGVTPAEKYVLHTVESGESLSMVAKKYYGDYKKFQIIAEYNQLEDATKVKVGQEIKVPVIEGIPFLGSQDEIVTVAGMAPERPVTGVTPAEKYVLHTVESGESLSKLALRYYGDYKKFPIIARYNQLDENVGLTVGQEIKIPEIEGVSFAEKSEEKAVQPAAPPVITAAGEEAKAVEEEREEGRPEAEEKEEQEEEEMELAAVDQSANYRELGIEFFDAKDYRAAISEFEKVLNVNPADEIALKYISDSHFQQGLVVFAKEEYLTARDEFRASLEYNPECEKCEEYIKKSEETYLEIHYNKGVSYFGDEKLAEAVQEWELVCKIDPEYKDVSSNLNKAKKLLERLESIKRSKTKQ